MENLEPVERSYYSRDYREPNNKQGKRPQQGPESPLTMPNDIVYGGPRVVPSALDFLRAVVNLVETTKTQGGNADDVLAKLPDEIVEKL